MSYEIAIWILGSCIVLMAVAMVIQGAAAISMFLTVRRLLPKGMQTVQKGKSFARETQDIFGRTKPAVLRTTGDVKTIAHNVADMISAIKLQLHEIGEPLARLKNKIASFSLRQRPARAR
jgi:hypothetical protein